jgi:ribose-phosphate pyrophosphokinase
MKSTYSPIRECQIFSGRANPELAQAVAEECEIGLSPIQLEDFADGEIKCRLDASVRGNYVFAIQSHGGGEMDVNKAVAEHELIIDAARGGSADRVIAVCPYLGYGRQDRKSAGRESIAAGLTIDRLTRAGANPIVGFDLHAPQIQGFTRLPFDNLTAAALLRNTITPELEKGVVIVASDAGGVKAAIEQRKRIDPKLEPQIAYINKVRDPNSVNEVEVLELVGDVKGRQTVIVEDMIDTAGTLKEASDLLSERGAADQLVIATHAVLSGKAPETLARSALRKVVVTNTRALTEEQKIDKIQVASVARIIAQAIEQIFTDGSISKLFEGENLK